jgi:hypothetical protein
LSIFPNNSFQSKSCSTLIDGGKIDSIDLVSLKPLPVIKQQIFSSSLIKFFSNNLTIAAIVVQLEGSANIPSKVLNRLLAARVSSSETVTASPPEFLMAGIPV